MAEKGKVVNDFMEEFEEARSARSTWRDSMVNVYRLYRLTKSKKAYAWQSNIVVPKVLEVVEANTAKLLKGLFNYKPLVNIYPTNAFEVMPAQMTERAVNDRYTSLEGVLFFYEWIKMTAMFGFAPVKSTYDAMAGKLVDELVDPFAFIPDPYATTRNMNYCFEMRWPTLDHLKRMAEYGIYDPDAVKKLDEVFEQTPSMERSSEIGYEGAHRSTRIRVIERWEDGNLKVLANDEIIIRDEQKVFQASHGEHPFTVMHCTPVPLEFLSMGDGEVVKSSNEELNEIRNQRMDNLTLYMNQVLLVDDNKVDMGDPLWRPGKIIWGPTDSVKPLVQPNTSAAGIDMENVVREDAEAASGSYRYALGSSPQKSGETATGIISLQSKGNERYDVKLMLAGHAVTALAQKHTRLLQAYSSSPISLSERVNGQWKFDTIEKEMLQGKFRFTAGVIAASEDRFIRRRDLIDMYREFKDRPDVVNIPAFIKRVIETMDLPDSDELVMMPGNMPMQPGNISPMLGGQDINQPGSMPGGMPAVPPAQVAPMQDPFQGGIGNVIPFAQQ
jgi:hypothetical protein